MLQFFPLPVIPILSFYCLHFYKTIKNKFQLQMGMGRRKKFKSDIDLRENLIGPLIGFHAITGNDYVSSFFRKGKKMFWGISEER